MRILALETTGKTGSVAAWSEGALVAERELPATQRNAQSLAPAIRDLLAQAGWQPGEVELIAVAQGPGSFTGLRVGIVTAKTLAYATGAQVLGVNTLEAIAAAAPQEVVQLEVVMDAFREQVFVGSFERAAQGDMAWRGETRIVDSQIWIDELSPSMPVSGPMLRKLASRLPSTTTALPDACWEPRARDVARIAERDYLRGRRDDLWGLVPQYYRASAAEEKLQSSA